MVPGAVSKRGLFLAFEQRDVSHRIKEEESGSRTDKEESRGRKSLCIINLILEQVRRGL